jgi:hypothetical protein
MPKTEHTRSRSGRRTPVKRSPLTLVRPSQVTGESARALLERIAAMRTQAEQLHADLEALCGELPEGDIGPADDPNHLVELRYKAQSCLEYMRGAVSLLQPDEDDAECVLRQLEQIAHMAQPFAASPTSDPRDTSVRLLESIAALEVLRALLIAEGDPGSKYIALDGVIRSLYQIDTELGRRPRAEDEGPRVVNAGGTFQ